jgi:DDE family transposase
MDNGPESSRVRTQFLNRMVQFADRIGKSIQLLYYPPYPSTYTPVERCWGIRELHMLAWAQNMTWKGIHPVVELSHTLYPNGVSLSRAAMRAVGAQSTVTPMGHSDSPGGGSVIRDILSEKSP